MDCSMNICIMKHKKLTKIRKGARRRKKRKRQNEKRKNFLYVPRFSNKLRFLMMVWTSHPSIRTTHPLSLTEWSGQTTSCSMDTSFCNLNAHVYFLKSIQTLRKTLHITKWCLVNHPSAFNQRKVLKTRIVHQFKQADEEKEASNSSLNWCSLVSREEKRGEQWFPLSS